MKNLMCFLIYLVGLSFISCNQTTNENREVIKVSTSESTPNADQFESKIDVRFAEHFSVSYHGNYKIVKTDAAFFDRESNKLEKVSEDILVLVQKGTETPTLNGELKNAKVIKIPIEEIAVNIQHSESFLRELDLEDRITCIGGLYSYNDEMRNKALSGTLGQIGYSWHSPPDIEVLLSRDPDLFLMTLASMEHNESLEKCRSLGIPSAAVFDWAESEYLARAEWIKFYSLFFNAEKKANEVFDQIVKRISNLKSIASETDQASGLWGYYSGKGKWRCQISGFPAQYMRDANLTNVLIDKIQADPNGSQSVHSEQLLSYAKDVDHWFIGDIHGANLPNDSYLSFFKAWNENKLYHNRKRYDPKSNASDWYATAIVRPDMVLADLIKLVHPQLMQDYKTVFMDVIDKENFEFQQIN